jgi:hypothetical protein
MPRGSGGRLVAFLTTQVTLTAAAAPLYCKVTIVGSASEAPLMKRRRGVDNPASVAIAAGNRGTLSGVLGSLHSAISKFSRIRKIADL